MPALCSLSKLKLSEPPTQAIRQLGARSAYLEAVFLETLDCLREVALTDAPYLIEKRFGGKQSRFWLGVFHLDFNFTDTDFI